MKWLVWWKGWPVTFLGITAFSSGCALNSGLEAGLIASGISMMVAGTVQYVVER